MKKNILFSAAFGLLAVAFSACSDDVDCKLAQDNEKASAVATLYTYAAEGDDYDPDCDLKVRLVKSPGLKAAYLLVEDQKVKDEYIESYTYKYEDVVEYKKNAAGEIVDSTIVKVKVDSTANYNEEKYYNHVIEKGQEAAFDADNAFEVMKTNLLGDWRIVAVSVADNGKKSSQEVLFHGVGWITLCTGTYSYGILGGLGLTPKSGVALQQNADDASLYRIKNAYADGVDFQFTSTGVTDEDEDGVYTVLRVPDQPVGLTYGSYGSIRVRDIGVWQGDDAWAYPESVGGNGYVCGMYEDYNCFFMCQFYVSAGNLGYNNYDQFIPDNAGVKAAVFPMKANQK